MNDELVAGVDLGEEDDELEGAAGVDVLDGIGLDPADEEDDDFDNPVGLVGDEEDEKGWGMD